MAITHPAGTDGPGLDVFIEPGQLDPSQLDTDPAGPPLLVAPAPSAQPESAVAAAPGTRSEQLTMVLAPADLPDVEPASSCPVCGVLASVDDTFCQACGLHLTNDRSHFSEQPAQWLAAVTDVGIRHPHNEDAAAVDADETTGSGCLVVCDGVSSTDESDLASLVAARAARDALRRLDEGIASGTDVRSTGQVLADGLAEVVETAHQAVLRQTSPDSGASCTIAAALVRDDLVASIALGDSRIYWLPDPTPTPAPEARADDLVEDSTWSSARLLSVDDSVAELRIAAGMDRVEAEQAHDAHVITGWIGHHATGPRAEPVVVCPDRPGWLLLCTDGLWNYASAPEDVAALIAELTVDLHPGALPLADALVRWAVEQGGRDNITAALARIPFGSR